MTGLSRLRLALLILAVVVLGTVSKVTKAHGDLQQDILVKPLVDFSRLDYVKVLRPSPGR